jgi:hypothetical protein
MNPLIQLGKAIPVLLVVLACLGLSPVAQALLPPPPPDGGYPNGNTAEGARALFKLTTGTENTAMGLEALFNDMSGGFNTATGSGALHENTTGHSNTAIGRNALFMNNGNFNTAVGRGALALNKTGGENTATGLQALFSNTTGGGNTATGTLALFSNTNGFQNNAFGDEALFSNTVGNKNVAVGTSALLSLTSGTANIAVGGASLALGLTINNNTALGRRALFRTQGDQNTGVGFFSGSNLNGVGTNNIYIGNVGPVPIGTESNTIRIGTQTATVATVGNPPIETHPMPAHTAAFLAGISGTPVVGDTVVVDANGQLGTATSSARFKKNIEPMNQASEAILALKPARFQYKADCKGTPQFGLIAEEVAKVNPDLVVRDRDGEIYSVRYEAVNAMLLNEFLKEHKTVQEQGATIARLQKQIEALTAGLQTVSARLEASKAGPQVVLNNQ